MGKHIFLTGFPGFIAKRLVKETDALEKGISYHFLIQEHMWSVADEALAELNEAIPGFADRCTLIVGDITHPTLKLSDEDYKSLSSKVTQIWHLAAIYDLATDESVAYNVNVVGTKHILDFAESCKKLKRLDYVSTCYVSGNRTGLIMESDGDIGQEFKNHYESTKCWAEAEIHKRKDTIPTAIYRPGIVMGDSKTGVTDKYDGPYFLILLLMRLPKWIPMVNIGAGSARPNLVPVDYVVKSMAYIASKKESLGKTFALSDPNPHTAKDIIKGILQSLERAKAYGKVPSGLLEFALSSRLIRKMVKIPKEAIIYFNHDVTYDSTNTQDLLKESGITCPDFLETLPTLVNYVLENPKKDFLDKRQF